MVIRKLSWLILLALCIGAFAYFGSSIAMVMGLLLILIPLVGIPGNLYIRSALRISVSAQGSMRKGKEDTVSLICENGTMLPALRLVCRIRVENQLNRETKLLTVHTGVAARREKQVQLTLCSDYCGRMKLSLVQVKLYDCFGLVGIPCKCCITGHIPVLPDTFAMEVRLLPTANSHGESELYSQERPGSDLTETFQIREYVPGDSPRQVHWKLSSKFDRLIVRDPALPITHSVLVFWERTGESGDPERIDAQAEVVVSLCRSLLEASIPFTVGWNDTDRNLCILHDIPDMDALVGIIPRLLRATGASAGVSGADLLLRTRPDALCAHMVYIAEQPQSEMVELRSFGHVTPLVCGQQTVENGLIFDSVHHPQQLAQIEI